MINYLSIKARLPLDGNSKRRRPSVEEIVFFDDGCPDATATARRKALSLAEAFSAVAPETPVSLAVWRTVPGLPIPQIGVSQDDALVSIVATAAARGV